MVKDIQAFITEMRDNSVPCDMLKSTSWGELTRIKLPGGGKVGVYEPRHARPRVNRMRTISNPRTQTEIKKA